MHEHICDHSQACERPTFVAGFWSSTVKVISYCYSLSGHCCVQAGDHLGNGHGDEHQPLISFRLQHVDSDDLIEFPETAEGYVSKVGQCCISRAPIAKSLLLAELSDCLWENCCALHLLCIQLVHRWNSVRPSDIADPTVLLLFQHAPIVA